jgi:fumarylacetoacetase
LITGWLREARDSGYGPDNLPLGVFSRPGRAPQIGARVGDHVLDLGALLGEPDFLEPSLNRFLARGSTAWRATRLKIGGRFASAGQLHELEPYLVELARVRMHPPFDVADLVRFCSGSTGRRCSARHRAGEDPAVGQGRAYLPCGTHGRASTVIPSGTDIIRPWGQRWDPEASRPVLAATQCLRAAPCLGYVVGVGSQSGRAVSTGDFAQHVFGVVLMGDWYACDFLAWECADMGPFSGMNFAASISPWVVPLDALGGARVPGSGQDPPALPHLRRVADWGLDITMELSIGGTVRGRVSCRDSYWTGDQLLAHLTSNGASLRTGDLYLSSPVAGERSVSDQAGHVGSAPLLADGDVVDIAATAHSMTGGIISLGEVRATVRPGAALGA